MSTPTGTLPPSALPLHTVGETAKQLGVSLTFLYERIRSKTIPTVNLGTEAKKKLRIRDDDLQQFIADRTIPAIGEVA